MSSDFGVHVTSFAVATASFVAVTCDQDCNYFKFSAPVDMLIATDTSTAGAQQPLAAGASFELDSPPILFPTYFATRYNTGDTLFFAKSKKTAGTAFLQTAK